MTAKYYVRVLSVTSLALLASCADAPEDDSSYGDVDLVDSRELALNGTDVQFINGSYTNCIKRTGTWSLPVTGNPTLDHTILSVIQRDTACTLALTEIVTTGDGKLAAGTPITLGTSYGTAQSFGSPIKYYANAILSSVAFTGNFTLTLLFSDDPRVGTGSATATYAAVTATADSMTVPAPNYTIDLASVLITTDFNKVVQAVSGNVALTAGSATGETYVIVAGAVGDTYAAINTAYLAGSTVATAATIAATAFIAPGVDLTSGAVRSLIIAKTTSGVRSYQKFAITFNPPI